MMNNSFKPAGWRKTACTSVFAGLAGLTVGAFALAPAAGAAGPTVAQPLVKPAGSASSSTYLGGYHIAPSGGMASASTTFTIPKLTCTAAQKEDGAAIFNGVYTDSLDIYAFVLGECTGSKTQYDYTFFTPDGGFTEPGANPGDVVVTSLFETNSDSVAEIHDLTNGEYWVAGDPTDLNDTSVNIGTFNELTDAFPVADFGKVTFANATVNGDDLGFESPTRYNALNGGDTLVKTSNVKTTVTGSTFSATYKKSS